MLIDCIDSDRKLVPFTNVCFRALKPFEQLVLLFSFSSPIYHVTERQLSALYYSDMYTLLPVDLLMVLTVNYIFVSIYSTVYMAYN